jgi:hypothetical protein
MRKVIENQLKIGQVDIKNIQIDLDCRDEIPQLLLGLKTIYSNQQLRDSVFEVLENIIPKNIDTGNGRPGMYLWNILVLGTLRLNCNWDYDKLHDIANNHNKVREFLGHTDFDVNQSYKLQTIKDNLRLFTPQVLDEINQLVVQTGHKMFVKDDIVGLKGRCDSFVVETDVHYPTDINLLLDAIRKIVFLTGQMFSETGITEWRQYRHIFRKIKKQFNFVRRLKHSSSKDKEKKAQREQLIIDAHREYVDLVELYVVRAKESIDILGDMDLVQMAHIMLIDNYVAHAERQIDQIRRRVLNGETIAHHEKVFSIFEEHTDWIKKGKAGVSQELGLGVCVLEDQYGFILHHHVMEKQKDVEIAVLMVSEAKRRFSYLSSCSFDKGFYSPENKKKLHEILEKVVLPKKGKLSRKDKQVEYSDDFIESRRKHSAVESAINSLENHGLDRCPDHGIDGFKRYVSLAVLARNIQVLGAKVRQKELKRLKRIQMDDSGCRLAA